MPPHDEASLLPHMSGHSSDNSLDSDNETLRQAYRILERRGNNVTAEEVRRQGANLSAPSRLNPSQSFGDTHAVYNHQNFHEQFSQFSDAYPVMDFHSVADQDSLQEFLELSGELSSAGNVQISRSPAYSDRPSSGPPVAPSLSEGFGTGSHATIKPSTTAPANPASSSAWPAESTVLGRNAANTKLDLSMDQEQSNTSSSLEEVEEVDSEVMDSDGAGLDRKFSAGSSASAGSSSWSLVGVTAGEIQAMATGEGSTHVWQAFDPTSKEVTLRPSKRQRKPFKDMKKRSDTGKTRRLKACVRCRMQKLRCETDESDPTGICQTCKAVSHQRIYKLPCVRHKLTECALFRRGKGPGLEFTARWPTMALRDITEWASDEIRTIDVMSDVSPVPLQLKVRRFIPDARDATHRGWMDGKIKRWTKTTPWAIVNMQAAMEDMRVYITNNIFSSVDFFLTDSDAWVVETYKYARKHMIKVQSEDEKKLLANFFRLWFAIRRTATLEHIIGKETLDMGYDSQSGSPYGTQIPLPPVMIQQLDIVLTLGVLDALQKQVLEAFQKLVMERKPSSWMTVYLITFMSLHDCARITEENYRNARKHGLIRRYSMPQFIFDRHHGANVFLSHYHYLNQLHNAFKTDWPRRHATPFADFSTEDIHFVRRTQEFVEEHRGQMKGDLELELFEDELYYIAQMFEDDWNPRSTKMDVAIETVNNVPLRKFGE